MADFAVTTFSAFAGLMLAARKLATDDAPRNRAVALADLAGRAGALAGVLRDTGLAPIAQEIARGAEETAAHFTHGGWARDDARAVFWQVAPAALADPEALAGALDPGRIADRMVAAITASAHARDFASTALAEQLFRAVIERAVSAMCAEANLFAAVTPDRWRRALRDHGVPLTPPPR